MIKYLFLLLMLCSPALASLSGSDDDSNPWEKLLENKSESPLRRSPTSVKNLCESDKSSDSNALITDYKNLTRHYDLVTYAYLDQLKITISRDFNHHFLDKKGRLCSGKVNPVSCYMKIAGKDTFARIKATSAGVAKNNSLDNLFDVYELAVGPLGCMGEATLRIPKLINDLSNQASLTFKRDKNILFPLKLESLIYEKPSNEKA
jgi:hypothetical protein